MPSPGADAACHLRVESVERFSGDVAKVRDELDGIAAGDRALIACHNEAEQHRLGEIHSAFQNAIREHQFKGNYCCVYPIKVNQQRQVVEAIVYRDRSGIPWRDLPPRFGAWPTAWKRHHRWSADGTWDRVRAALDGPATVTADQIGSRNPVSLTVPAP